MTKLSDTQLVILQSAAARQDYLALPFPPNLRGGAATKVVTSLLQKGLLEEADAGRNEPVWRDTGDGHGRTLVLTAAAFDALGIDHPKKEEPMTAIKKWTPEMLREHVAAHPEHTMHELGAFSGLRRAEIKSILSVDAIAPEKPKRTRKAAEPKAPRDTKKAQLIAMLTQEGGTTLDDVCKEFGWQQHTARSAITAGVGTKMGNVITSEKVDGVRRYAIAARETAS